MTLNIQYKEKIKYQVKTFCMTFRAGGRHDIGKFFKIIRRC